MKKQAKSRDEDEDDSDEDSDDDDEDSSDKFIPASLEVNLTHGARTVSALSVDHSGARLVTGSVDYDVKLWDFAGMSASMNAFRTIRPVEWYFATVFHSEQLFFIVRTVCLFQSPYFGSSLLHHGGCHPHHFWIGSSQNSRPRWI